MRARTAFLMLLMIALPLDAGDTTQADALFAKRACAKDLESATTAYERAGAHVMVARCCLLRLESFDDLKEKDDRLPWIERGMKAGEAALGTDEVADKLEGFAKRDAEALYWYAALYGLKTDISSIFSQAGMAKKFHRMAERVVELDGALCHAGPHRMLGTFLIMAPGFMGGDDERGARELDEAVRLAPNSFENLVARARHADALGKNPAAAFRADLDKVLKTPPAILPDVVPEQVHAQADARRLLANPPKGCK